MAHRKPFERTAEEIIAQMLRRTLAGKDGRIYTISWHDSADKSDIDSDHMRLRDEHAQPLIAAGLLHRTTTGSIYYGLTPAGIRAAIPLVGHKPLDVRAMVERCLDSVLFGPSKALDGRTAIPALYDPSKTGSKLVLVLGENAAGKSLFRRVVRMVTHKGKKAGMGDAEIRRGDFPVGELLHFSMQSRASGGMASAFIYGDESWQSTGTISAHTIEGACRNCTEREHTTIVYWDEPDIGMSAGAAAGAGVAIREFIVKDEAPLLEAVFLTSHSPALVRQLVPLDPHYVFLGNSEGPKTLADWFIWQQDPPPISPDALGAIAHARFRDVQAVLAK